MSASDSDADGAIQAILDPFASQREGGKKKQRRVTIEKQMFFEKQLNMLGSSRGSSLIDELDASIAS